MAFASRRLRTQLSTATSDVLDFIGDSTFWGLSVSVWLAIILAILCGAELAGVAGIFLAIPVVAVLSVMHRHWLEYRGSAGLVADFLKPAEPPLIVPPMAASQAVTPSPARPPVAGGEPARSKRDPSASGPTRR